MNKKLGLIILMAVLSIANVNAQSTADMVSTNTALYIVAGFVFIVALLVLGVSVVVLRLLRVMVRQELEKKATEKGVEFVEEESWWSKFMQKANDAVPVEEEETVLLDHNYDGIRELDNHLPPWWKWMFYLSIVFAVVYMLGYHVIGNMPLQLEEYKAEVYAANEAAKARLANAPVENVDANSVVAITDAASLQKGKQIYLNNCSQCHKDLGEGGIGPNLTDDYWLHGGDISSVFTTIQKGVPEKGMISWEPLLSPTQMQNVASYILTLRGTNPPNAKEPQGELFVPEVIEDALDSVDTEEVKEAVDSLQMASNN
ncbi:cbb3-type cytochrome c oxidase N-terminal domain-containing protein [Fulvivirga lutea]|uniref:C-type cytochrome n=1 Tax=Fulvivirga lutea TaxID=2810512 RepID=A0A974WES1_9BACT|nr:cbb3-type cytochrome c oxidase N-terminal domain-containing protein [Fulvivirga lutea]QSE96304.1 c-type cytochrome [Fulvivirga lutea]